MDSHLWEADLCAIRAGTAPRQELVVRYLDSEPIAGEDLPLEAWLEVFEDEAGTRPLVRVPVAPDLGLAEVRRRAEVVGWPAPGRALALADGPVLPRGPSYPLNPPLHLPPMRSKAKTTAVLVGLAVVLPYSRTAPVAITLVVLAVGLRWGPAVARRTARRWLDRP